MAPPNAFTNELEKWIYEKCISSVVFVEFRKKNYDEVKDLWNRVSPIVGKGAAQRKMERTASLDFGHFCTGFVVKAEENRVLILTCAHVLGESFSETQPITVEEVENYFDVFIICDHHAQARQERQVSVEEISCGTDLILLSLPKNEFDGYCPLVHTPISMAPSYPDSLEKVVMLSWPPLSHRTAVSGETSHPLRLYNDLSSTNPKGFTCRLAQVNIVSDGGSSGAPLINGAGQFLCTLHGGFGGRFSYFVCFEDLRNMLLAWGVL